MNKEKVIIFGAGSTGKKIFKEIKTYYNIICFIDNDSTKWGTVLDNIVIYNPEKILKIEYDKIILGSITGGIGETNELLIQLISMGICNSKIDRSFIEIPLKAREIWLSKFAENALENHYNGNVAEAGVYRGEFAKLINRYFNNRTCYLFDTFEGFSEKDLIYENPNIKNNHLNNTSENLVLSKMPYPELCIIKKGYFPDTAVDIDDDFCFVNLDMDLYKPTLEGLRFFYPKMVEGGIILIHDFYSEAYPNIKKAVYDFENQSKIKLKKCPIGDGISIAIIK